MKCLFRLEHEKRKVTQLKVQLQLVKANHVIQYLPKKSADVRKLVEVRDKGVQTWGGVLCRACLDTEQLRNKLERTQDLYNDCIVIKRYEHIFTPRYYPYTVLVFFNEQEFI